MSEVMELSCRTETVLTPCSPFHFDGTFHSPSNFPSSDLQYQPGRFCQSVRWQGQVYGARFDNLGNVEEPAVRLTLFSAAPLSSAVQAALTAELAFRYDLYVDLSPFYEGYAQDELLGPVLTRWRGARTNNNTSLYEFLVIATVLQNATLRRSVQMMENLFARYGSRVAFDGLQLSAFWRVKDMQRASEEDLRALKVGYRARAFLRQAAAFGPDGLQEEQLRRLPTPELKKELLKLYGVGPASVWYLLFSVFKRYEVFEYLSPWEQKIYSRLLFQQELVDAPTILSEVERRWGQPPLGRWKMLAAHLVFEDLFWQHQRQPIPWLRELIRL